ncbi:MAG: precorrin-6y C5,15-methyltransferase (decarboxylating) subunit CbiE [Leptolyngbyaceae cyanobacterium]
MTLINVIGIGLDGAAGLSAKLQAMVQQAKILAGSARVLSYFPNHAGERWPLENLPARLQQYADLPNAQPVVVLASGDPLFFGLGRQLLQAIAADQLTFHPHVSAVQLAFSRAKLPWQNATLISAHGRSLQSLVVAVQQGQSLIAILTDPIHTPATIADLISSLQLPVTYDLWICENLGGAAERIRRYSLATVPRTEVAPLNVVILQRVDGAVDLANLPLLGIPDGAFLSFRDRPGLMTKREVRVQILAELALQPHQIIWDIGAGTGSVSIEIARLVPTAQIWAVEKTPAGQGLIQQNVQRFQTPNVTTIAGQAPAALKDLPSPHRVFIGGSQGQLGTILATCAGQLAADGVIVVALATLETTVELIQWQQQRPHWCVAYQQVAMARSAAVGPLTRWQPLTPIVLATLRPSAEPTDQRQGVDQ